MSRTVNPVLVRAVASRVRPQISLWHELSTDDGTHRSMLETLLVRDGVPGVVTLGVEFARSSNDELLTTLAATHDVHELLQVFGRLEKFFHLGHRTITRYEHDTLFVEHIAHHGPPPVAAESLFVMGCFIGMFERIGVCDLQMKAHSQGREDRHSNERRPELVPNVLRNMVSVHPSWRWRLVDAAAAMCTSVRTMQREFQYFDTTVSTTVVAGRVDSARALLERTSLDVGAIAVMCGFFDSSHMTKAFLRCVGNSPGDYRHRSRGDQPKPVTDR